jgi:hypothetical protein
MAVQETTGIQREETCLEEAEFTTYIFIACPQELFLRIEGESGHWG